MKFCVIFCFLIAAVAHSQVPGDRIVPPGTLFGETYDRSDNEPEWDEYIDGTPLHLGESPTGLQLCFSKASLATLLIVAYSSEEGALKNFMGGRVQMEKQPAVKLSPVSDVQAGKYFTTQVLGRHSCSMVIANVHFVINDPGGDLSGEKVLEWSNRYADFLRKSVQSPNTGAKSKPLIEEWKGTNGNTIRGAVKSLNRERQSVEFEMENGMKIPELPLAKFSESDRDKILERFSK
ncbi:MAG: hypothetical protein B7Z47_00270 [Chthoniobacter sp. 12-60-6]|nr:MAG: hypothetical protein B7Z47_00270 [Chthoniobacter sp. 12-60-6]